MFQTGRMPRSGDRQAGDRAQRGIHVGRHNNLQNPESGSTILVGGPESAQSRDQTVRRPAGHSGLDQRRGTRGNSAPRPRTRPAAGTRVSTLAYTGRKGAGREIAPGQGRPARTARPRGRRAPPRPRRRPGPRCRGRCARSRSYALVRIRRHPPAEPGAGDPRDVAGARAGRDSLLEGRDRLAEPTRQGAPAALPGRVRVRSAEARRRTPGWAPDSMHEATMSICRASALVGEALGRHCAGTAEGLRMRG